MKDWTLWVAPWAAKIHGLQDSAIPLFLERFRRPDHLLKDDRRSVVGRLDQLPLAGLGPGPWVCKRPRWHDQRLWNRMLSLVREGEMRRAFNAALHLERLGLATPRPVLCVERRRWGMLVESWLLYEFAPGEAIAEAQWPAVVEALKGLHQAGLRHGDPHLANWLSRGGGGVLMLDPGPRPLRPACADAEFDFILLRNCQPAIQPLLPMRSGWRLRVAEARNAWVQGWRRLKRKLRGGGFPR